MVTGKCRYNYSFLEIAIVIRTVMPHSLFCDWTNFWSVPCCLIAVIEGLQIEV